ncbi:MAG: LemA family protein [Bacteroidales bacterium]|jgi:LemA protein|nr:LemA family protein [Bacteroidales bacterium]
MNKTIWIIIIAAVALGLYVMAGYNRLVKADEAASSAWAQVENVYQRRADLIPNLVNTVKGSADFESSTLQNVIEARAAASGVKVDPSKLSEGDIANFEKAQGNLSSALNRLMVVVERYPDLKSSKNFLELQAQLEGTENRITVERMKFNEVVQKYNVGIRRFPGNIIAGMFDFEKKGYFQATEGADKAPEVSFDFKK